MLNQPPQRIVSSVLAADEILLELVAPARLAAVTLFVDNPAYSGSVGRAPANVPRISGNLETVISLTPDLVILAPYNRAETVTQLASLAIPLVRIDRFASLADVAANIRLLGRATGTDEGAESLVRDLDRRIERVEAHVRNFPRPRVLFWQPGGYTVGPATITDEIIERAGGHNVARDARFEGNAVISSEAVLGLHPDVIVLSVPAMTPQADASALLPDDPTWRAVVGGSQPCRVMGVPAAWISSVSHHAVRGLEALAALLHPEIPYSP